MRTRFLSPANESLWKAARLRQSPGRVHFEALDPLRSAANRIHELPSKKLGPSRQLPTSGFRKDRDNEDQRQQREEAVGDPDMGGLRRLGGGGYHVTGNEPNQNDLVETNR